MCVCVHVRIGKQNMLGKQLGKLGGGRSDEGRFWENLWCHKRFGKLGPVVMT